MNKNEIVKTTSPIVPAELNDQELLRLADTIVEIVQSALSEIATRITSYWYSIRTV